MTVTADNAFNNQTMCIGLAKILPASQGMKSYVRCFAHILNLIVMVRPHLCHDYLSIIYVLTSFFFSKVILSPFVTKKAKKGRHRKPIGTSRTPRWKNCGRGFQKRRMMRKTRVLMGRTQTTWLLMRPWWKKLLAWLTSPKKFF